MFYHHRVYLVQLFSSSDFISYVGWVAAPWSLPMRNMVQASKEGGIKKSICHFPHHQKGKFWLGVILNPSFCSVASSHQFKLTLHRTIFYGRRIMRYFHWDVGSSGGMLRIHNLVIEWGKNQTPSGSESSLDSSIISQNGSHRVTDLVAPEVILSNSFIFQRRKLRPWEVNWLTQNCEYHK